MHKKSNGKSLLTCWILYWGWLLICWCVALAVLVVRVMSAHDKGSHAEVEVKVKKVLYQNPQMKIQRGTVTLYPESWTVQGCTCPILNPGQLQPLPMSFGVTHNAEANDLADSWAGGLPAFCWIEEDLCRWSRRIWVGANMLASLTENRLLQPKDWSHLSVLGFFQIQHFYSNFWQQRQS